MGVRCGDGMIISFWYDNWIFSYSIADVRPVVSGTKVLKLIILLIKIDNG